MGRPPRKGKSEDLPEFCYFSKLSGIEAGKGCMSFIHFPVLIVNNKSYESYYLIV
jgi:hypothetical protein